MKEGIFLKQIVKYIKLTLPFFIGAMVVLFIKMFIVTPVTVSGPSMNPNLHDGEHLLAFKHTKLHRGDVIIFDANGLDPNADENKIYVKRIIGIPGDIVEAKNGILYVNGTPVNQSYISKSQQNSGTGNWTLSSLAQKNNWAVQNISRIPSNSYFVLGDNRKISNDSRYWGFVPVTRIIGKVKVPVWSEANKNKRANINLFWHYFFEFQN